MDHDDNLSFDLEEDDEPTPPQPAVPRDEQHKRVVGFWMLFKDEPRADGWIMRRGKYGSYEHYDSRRLSKHEQRIQNVYWFACGFFAFAMVRFVILFG